MMALLLLLLQVAASGTISGRVTSGHGEPVAGAQIRIGALDRRDVATASGAYHLDSIPDGRWVVRVEAEGYEPREVVVRVAGGRDVALDFELEASARRDPVSRTISGVVLEDGRLEPIHFAVVEVLPLGRRVVTDQDGLFALGGIPPGLWTLRISAPGYEPLERPLRTQDAEALEFRLQTRPFPLDALVVRGNPTRALIGAAEPEAQVVDSAMASLMPAVLERDVLRTVQILPSVTPASDYNSAPSVRGGTTGQTRIVLDGVPMHNPFHVGGFVSAFEPSAVDAAVLHPGALPASAPSGLSGTVEVHTRDGGRDSVRVQGGAGLLSSALTISGPWSKGAFLISGRRTYIDLGTSAARRVGLIDAAWPYRFWDVLGKVTTDLGGRGGSLTVSSYLDREGFHDRGYAGTWGSDALSMRYRGLTSRSTTVEAGIATSGFGADFTRTATADSLPNAVVSDLDASVRTWVADAAVERSFGPNLFSAGIRWERTSVFHDLDPQGELVSLFTPLTVDGRYGTTAVFLRDRWRVGRNLGVDAGLRAEKSGGRAWALVPRGRLEWVLGDATALSLAGGAYRQDWWSLRNEEGVAASVVGYDITVPVPVSEALPTAWDLVLEGRTEAAGWTLRADIFRKRSSHVPTSQPVADPNDTRVTLDPDSVRVGRQQVDGAELFFTGAVGGGPLALSYRFQRERVRVGEETFVPRVARTHRLVINTRRSWGEREVAVGLTWMSGRPYTPALAVLPSWGGPDAEGHLGERRFGRRTVVLGDANSARLPAYLRVDVDVRGAWELTLFGRRGVLEPYLSVLNLFNGNNALYGRQVVRDGRLALQLGPQLPLFPSFGLRWRF